LIGWNFPISSAGISRSPIARRFSEVTTFRVTSTRYLGLTDTPGESHRVKKMYLTPAFWALALSLLHAGDVSAQTLHYQGYLAGVPAGSATVQLEISSTGYEISGVGIADGVAGLFSDYHNSFSASGRFENDLPVLETYSYEERDGRKHRRLDIRDGFLHVTKNGEPRPVEPALPGIDILTAFLIDFACEDKLLHTGRYNYHFMRLDTTDEQMCRFLLVDEDGDRWRADVVYARHDELNLPARLRVHGLIRGSMVLKEVER